MWSSLIHRNISPYQPSRWRKQIVLKHLHRLQIESDRVLNTRGHYVNLPDLSTNTVLLKSSANVLLRLSTSDRSQINVKLMPIQKWHSPMSQFIGRIPGAPRLASDHILRKFLSWFSSKINGQKQLHSFPKSQKWVKIVITLVKVFTQLIHWKICKLVKTLITGPQLRLLSLAIHWSSFCCWRWFVWSRPRMIVSEDSLTVWTVIVGVNSFEVGNTCFFQHALDVGETVESLLLTGKVCELFHKCCAESKLKKFIFSDWSNISHGYVNF